MRRREANCRGKGSWLGGSVLVLLAVLTVAVPLGAKERHPVARSAQLGGDDNKIEFVAELSRKVPIEVFSLANPYRVIVDLPEVQFNFPSGEGRSGKGLVSAFRYGLFQRGKSRIVIDVKGPVQVEKAVVEEPADGQTARLVISLARTGEAEFRKALAVRRKGDSPPAVQPVSIDAAAKPGENDNVGDTRPLIMIDPGHGGVDPGAIGSRSTLEKDVVLKFALMLKEKMLAGKRYRVKLTRDIDTYIPLHERVRLARNAKADLFLSIHADSLPRGRRRMQVRGASIYVLSEKASDKEAQELASLENRSDIIAGVELPDSEDPVSNILIDLAQRETNSLSTFFSQLQIKEMKGVVPMHGYITRSAGFRVLKAPDIPSVLIELGYISSPYDEKNLGSMPWLEKTAGTVHRAINAYFSQQVARSPF